MVVRLQETLNGHTNDLSTTPAPSASALDDGATAAAASSDAFLVASSACAWSSGGGQRPGVEAGAAQRSTRERAHLQGLHFRSQRADVHSDTGEALLR